MRLSQRFNLYLGAIFIIGFLILIFLGFRSNSALLEEIGLKEASYMSKDVFDRLYESMRRGGGRDENRAIIKSFEKINGIEEIRVIHGPELNAEHGLDEDDLPRDRFDRQALDGKTYAAIEKTVDGHKAARFVVPVIVTKDCVECHTTKSGTANGAISIMVSLKKYEGVIAVFTGSMLLWGAGVLVLSAVMLLVAIRRRLVSPLESLKEGLAAISRGELDHKVRLHTGDEIEELGSAFNKMGQSLLTTTTRLNDINERYTKLVDMAADAIVLKDIETHRFIEANPAATVFTGYSRDELLGKSTEDLYPREKLSEYMEIFKRWVYDGKGYLHDAAVISKDGAAVPVEIAASLLEIGKKKYIQEIWRDISERKGFDEKLKQQIVELEATVRKKTAHLEEAYAKLKNSEKKIVESAKLISLGEMGAGIAHELNSPLAGILSITDVLLGRLNKNDPNYYLLEKIKDAAVRSKYIILDMLTYARPFKGEFEPLYLNLVIKATLAMFISELKSVSIEIAPRLDPELPKVYGNKGQLMEVVLNIIKNARDAMAGEGKIFITTKVGTDDGREVVVMEIRDTGPGIPAEAMDRIFDPFFTTKVKGGGKNVGLGLSIAQSIVAEHGGKIWAENAPGGGAVMRVTLPFAPEEYHEVDD